jgi:hypothetical protein
MLADKMARQWGGIERAMNFANHNPAFRPQVELLVNTYLPNRNPKQLLPIQS